MACPKYKITHKAEGKQAEGLLVEAWRGKERIAYAYFVPDADHEHHEATRVVVSQEFRRCGIATSLYNRAEKVLKAPVEPSSDLSPAAAAFWIARRMER